MKPPRWTPAETMRLAELLEANHSYEEIGKKLGRRQVAVIVASKRKAKLRLTKAGGMTGRAVARLLGVDDHAVVWWIREGWLSATRYAMNRPFWRIEEEDLIAFLENDNYWHLWQPERLSDRYWREWCQEMREGVRFVGTREAGEMLGYQWGTVHQWINKGLLPARKHGPNWRIRMADLLVFKPPVHSPKGQKVRRFTAEEDAYILSQLTAGTSQTAIAARLGRSPSSIHGRWLRIKASGA